VLGVRVDAVQIADVVRQMEDWIARRESCQYIAVTGMHGVTEAQHDARFKAVLNSAGLVVPDGMPLVWMLRWLGARSATRVYGPDLTLAVLKQAEAAGIPIGFYGSTSEVIEHMVRNLRRRFPGVRVVFAEAPPFRPLTPEEDERTTSAINAAGVRILFVGLGTPKQDRWMHAHRGRVQAVMLGVGAAFDFLAGMKPQAPRWMQRSGLEWLFRLATEPRRLWRRYLRQNPRFAVLAVAQILRARMT